MNFKRYGNQRIRLVEGTDPNATGTGMGGSEGQTGSPAATTQQEPTITQAQLDAIISRKLAKEREKLEAAQKAAEDARKLAEETEARVKEARDKGISLGLLQAKRNSIAEQYGLSDKWMKAADLRVRIPMFGLADSLNVASATTILLFEAVRQRRV